MRVFFPLLMACLLAIPQLSHAQDRPFRGTIGMSVLLCKYADAPDPTRTAAFYRNMFINPGTGGNGDYWNTISAGSLSFAGSQVRGWYTLDQTEAEARAYGGGGSNQRRRKHSDCVDKARAEGYRVPAGHITVVVTSPDIDTFGFSGGAFLGENASAGIIGHEVGHALGYAHSFVDFAGYCNATWASVGEYGDRRDMMSYANVFSVTHPDFGNVGPGLNAYHLDRMGWLDRRAIHRFGADGSVDQTITLTSLSRTGTDGTRMIRIPIDPTDPYRYYTVEYRTVENFDAGIPVDTVLIHEIDNRNTFKCDDRTTPRATGYRSYLEVNATNTAVAESLNENGVRIDTVSKDPTTGRATVRVRSTRPQSCRQGLVWREAAPDDRVCVTRDRRTDIRAENSRAAERRQPGGGAFGPDTCRDGYVWREAVAGDRVCVRRDSRTRARLENGQARQNALGGAVFGPNTCQSGYVWREADGRDWVCVRPERRSEVALENSLAASRRVAGGTRCRAGFVWRDAFTGDRVCVTPQKRREASDENQRANDRLAEKGA